MARVEMAGDPKMEGSRVSRERVVKLSRQLNNRLSSRLHSSFHRAVHKLVVLLQGDPALDGAGSDIRHQTTDFRPKAMWEGRSRLRQGYGGHAAPRQ